MKQKPDPFETAADLGPLFPTPEKHLSGRTDPQTSRDAARSIMESLGKEQRWALDTVQYHPGKTAPELGALVCNIDEEHEHARQRIGRRLGELEKAGLIRREGERDNCSVWWPVDKP